MAYIYRKNDESGYYINDDGKPILISYDDFYKINETYYLIGACSVLDFNKFKPISFDFDMNLIYIEDESTVLPFDKIGLLKRHKKISGLCYNYVLVAFDEYLKEKKYYVDKNEKNILNSYENVINKYQKVLDEVKKSYYYKDSDYVKVLCENNEKFKFPDYLFPLLNNCPFDCSTIITMKNHKPNPIEKSILLKVVKIMELYDTQT